MKIIKNIIQKRIFNVILNLNIYYSAADEFFDNKAATFVAQDKALSNLGLSPEQLESSQLMQRALKIYNKKHEIYWDRKKEGRADDYKELNELEKNEINNLDEIRRTLFKNNNQLRPEMFLFRLAENKPELRGLQQEILWSKLENIYNREQRVLDRYYNSLSKDKQPNGMSEKEFKAEVIKNIKREIVTVQERWTKESDPQRKKLRKKVLDDYKKDLMCLDGGLVSGLVKDVKDRGLLTSEQIEIVRQSFEEGKGK